MKKCDKTDPIVKIVLEAMDDYDFKSFTDGNSTTNIHTYNPNHENLSDVSTSSMRSDASDNTGSKDPKPVTPEQPEEEEEDYGVNYDIADYIIKEMNDKLREMAEEYAKFCGDEPEDYKSAPSSECVEAIEKIIKNDRSPTTLGFWIGYGGRDGKEKITVNFDQLCDMVFNPEKYVDKIPAIKETSSSSLYRYNSFYTTAMMFRDTGLYDFLRYKSMGIYGFRNFSVRIKFFESEIPAGEKIHVEGNIIYFPCKFDSKKLNIAFYFAENNDDYDRITKAFELVLPDAKEIKKFINTAIKNDISTKTGIKMENYEDLENLVMQVLTEQNDIASTGIAGLRPGEIDPSSVESLVAEGLNNLKQLAPKHDPIRGHRASSHDEGASYFSGDDTPKGVPAKATAAPGHGGFDAARVVEAEYGGQIGVYAPPSRPIEGTIHIIPYHGDRLQAITTKEESKWQAGKPQPTNIASFVFTNEGGTWVLASAYPGKADPEPNFEGLKAGAVISPEEAAKRNLRVKCVEKEEQNAV